MGNVLSEIETLASSIQQPIEKFNFEMVHLSNHYIKALKKRAFYIVNYDTHEISHQKGVFDLLGYSKVDFQYLTIVNMIHPDDRILVSHIVKTAILCASNNGIDYRDRLHLRFRAIKKNGEEIFLERFSGPRQIDKIDGLISSFSVLEQIPYENAKKKIEFEWKSKFTSRDEFREQLMLRPTLSLSIREYCVLELLAKGFKARYIAVKLSITIETVNSHRKNILSKLGFRNWNMLMEEFHENIKWKRFPAKS